MKMNTRFPIALLACLLVASSGRAGDIHVVGSTGNDALDGATWATSVRSIGRALVLAAQQAGPDTIHVSAGTYAENVLVERGDVSLLGGYPAGGGARDPVANPTIVDGSATAPAITISGGSGRVVLHSVLVDGFTFRNGAPLGRANIFGAGAGVFMEESEVVLSHNVIESNLITGDGWLGAGLYSYRALAGPSRIENNILRNNVATDGLGGGAALIDFADPSLGRLSFSQNEVRTNQVIATAGSDEALALAQGAGLFIWGGEPVIAGNTIAGNVADSQSDAVASGQGAGVYIFDASPTLSNNVFDSNVARASSAFLGAAGGAMYGFWSDADITGGRLVADGNEVRDNRAEGGLGDDQGTGGGFALAVLDDSAPVVRNCDFSGNLATGRGPNAGIGGGIFAYVAGNVAATVGIDGGEYNGNAALEGGGGLWIQGGDPQAISLENLLVVDNQADYGSGIIVFGDAAVSNSRIRGNRVYDPDGDVVSEVQDNCRGVANPTQADADGDGQGDACDTDDDGDAVPDASDNCPLVANPGQGNACNGDADGDGVNDGADNCPDVANASQDDATLDGVGDACEPAAFDGLETNASGIWVTGDATLTNLEIVDNIGQGMLLVGLEADPGVGQQEDPTSAEIAHVTISGNDAAGFIMYLADGTTMRDSVVALNDLSDGFDTERPGGGPSSPNVDCDRVYFYDGIASLPCAGSGNMDFVDGPPLFASGFYGDHYLEQVASGGAADFVGIDRGGTSAASSVVAGLTTRTDAVADSGVVDIGFHYGEPPVAFDDPLGESVRVTHAGSRIDLGLTSVPPGVNTVRWYRGSIPLLLTEYSHASPFSGQPGTPECSAPSAVPVSDPAAFGDGNDYYYLAVDLAAGVEGTFGRDSQLALRPRPEDSPTDRVTNACP